ncbi:MAG: PASTA domain-containing protein [Acidobacteria bacterium]|nr:PASTA domain-containing protein [Acidobacteriota bacterium]
MTAGGWEEEGRPEEGRNPEVERRLAWVAGGVLLWAAILLITLLWLQVVEHGRYLRVARRQQELLVRVPAPRGSIFDRNGQPLAMSVPMQSVAVNPAKLQDPAVAADLLARLLELDRDALYARLSWARSRGRGFLWIKRKIPFEQAQRLKTLQYDWIEFRGESQRHYPKGALAAHLLGSVDHRERGNAGVERALDSELQGRHGAERLFTDVQRRGIESTLSEEPRQGADLRLAIDERIQFAAERDLGAAVEASGANSGSAVVMNPHDGDVLALASYPSYDPNQPPSAREEASARFNHAVSVPFEPGSVFKVFTLAAALETTNLRPETPIHCGNGTITLFGRTIREAKRGFGWIPMTTVLAKSSNVGAIQIGMRVGPAKLYDYVRLFGFGEKTAIPLPAESAGLLRKLSRWGKTSLGSVAMGHEISSTTLQLARACSVVANGGLLVKPRFILKRGAEEIPVETPRRALRPETAILMRGMMEDVVLNGTGTRARLQGYSSGGKTGSAQIFDLASRRYTHTYNASFMGFAPVGNPAIVVVVTLNGTQGGSAGFGGAVAAPVFRTIAQEALRVLDTPKDLPDEPPKVLSAPPVEDLAIADLAGEDATQVAEALSPAIESQPEASSGPQVPNFQGMTKRAVIEEAALTGLPVVVDGSGLARAQAPAAGSYLAPGQKIRVLFASR